MKWLVGCIIAICLLAAVGFGWYVVSVANIHTLPAPIEVTIPEQSGTEGAAQALQEAGVITSPWSFLAYATISGQRGKIRAGTYLFSGDVNLPLVLSIVTKQQSLQNEVEVTLLEGWTTQQMGEALAQALPFTADDYVRSANAQSVNGYLFPDTYRFYTDATVQDVIDKQVEAFHERFTPEMEAAVEANGRTLDDTVILASIVEKEAQTLTDKELVAGVFWKRIDNGQRLQSDVTVNYVTGNTTTDVSLSDTYVESAYNTYRNDGLPPGAISNPGYDALYAAVYPTQSDYWYFLATPEGEVIYSATYEEHLQYKAQYYP